MPFIGWLSGAFKDFESVFDDSFFLLSLKTFPFLFSTDSASLIISSFSSIIVTVFLVVGFLGLLSGVFVAALLAADFSDFCCSTWFLLEAYCESLPPSNLLSLEVTA